MVDSGYALRVSQRTFSVPASEPQPGPPPIQVGYEPGVCNIGPAEIARRRRTGHVGALASIVLLALLVAIDAPPVARLLLAVPATIAATGYLQAWLRFCAGFGALGVYNFAEVGRIESVAEAAARGRDRRRALQIGAASVGIGLAIGLIAVLLPI